MVVPEQRHFFLQRATAVRHAKQPALPGIVDDRGGGKFSGRRRAHVAGRPDLAVHVVGNAREIHELVNGGAETELLVVLQLRDAGTKAGAPEEMLDLRISVSH